MASNTNFGVLHVHSRRAVNVSFRYMGVSFRYLGVGVSDMVLHAGRISLLVFYIPKVVVDVKLSTGGFNGQHTVNQMFEYICPYRTRLNMFGNKHQQTRKCHIIVIFP
jgi:hypothetical protein